MGGGVSKRSSQSESESVASRSFSGSETECKESTQLHNNDAKSIALLAPTEEKVSHINSGGSKDWPSRHSNNDEENGFKAKVELDEEDDNIGEEELEELLARVRLLHGSYDMDEEFMQDGEDLNEIKHDEDNDEEEDPNLSENRENWQMLTNSLEMDNEDLLFNMLYFSDESAGISVGTGMSTIGSVINSAMTEAVALHSQNNTPYKLRPASELDLQVLEPETLSMNEDALEHLRSKPGEGCVECAVCMEELQLGAKILRLPVCQHYFHADCLMNWFRLQNWCPVCRTPISKTSVASSPDAGNHGVYKAAECCRADSVTAKCIASEAALNIGTISTV